ncbi:MAG: hypothetical protein OEQ18_12040 [Gammaproteobacteria bacterium]|nr:hypothetical protein [Gammaproteobacteria bacterium]
MKEIWKHSICRLVGHAALAAGLTSLLGCAGVWDRRGSADQSKPAELARAGAGDVDAQYEVGRYYAQRSRRDEAVYWLCSAAVSGHLDAQLSLARLYEWQGKGPSSADKTRLTNRGSAYFWYTAAAAQGSDEALLARDVLARKMAGDAVSDARRRATRWRQARCTRP